MINTYQKFLRKNLDLMLLGIECSTNEEAYFCTPKGASIIGRAGVDGIHYCFIRGFGEMVFAVSPENESPEYVHPLAKNFTDFLRLLLACWDTSALEQAWMWDEEQFEKFLQENPTTAEQKKILDRIAVSMNLSAMEQPWRYMNDLQSSFDYGKIKYTEDFCVPDRTAVIERKPVQWKVFFEGNFWGHHGTERAGKEITVGKEYEWAGRHWRIPAVYSCGKGLVIDCCMQIDPEQIRAFMEKWDINGINESEKHFTPEQMMEIEADNPLSFDLTLKLRVNGQLLQMSRGCSICYNPCQPDGGNSDLEAKWAVSHYGLDASCGWLIQRHAFRWKTKRRPKIKTLSLIMRQRPVPVPGPHFHTMFPGESFEFVYPENGERYTLTVQRYKRQTMTTDNFRRKEWDFPTHYHAMDYTITPDISDGAVTIRDCAESDCPKERQQTPVSHRTSSGAAAIGIIGGACGVTSVICGADRKGEVRAAFSSLHFEPVDNVEWGLVFHEKQFGEVTIGLI